MRDLKTQTSKKTPAVIYCRVSSAKQVEEGDGLKSQETRCREYAAREGYDVLKVFADKGVSGGVLDRPKMREMLSFLLARPEPNTVVLIDDLNRFSRDVRVHWQLRELVQNAGGLLESPSMKFGDSSDDKLVENLLASVSQHQREKMGEQSVNRSRARLQSGYSIVSRIIGYKYKQTKTEGKVLVRDEPVASIIAEALEGFASGRFASQSEVLRFLEGQPDFPKQKHYGGIRIQKVTDLLRHPIYAGYVKSDAWDVSLREGRHEGLISFATHKKIQKRLDGGAVAPVRKDVRLDFPLRGFVTCADCERPLRSCWSKSCTGKRYPYYLCQTRGCASYGKSIKRDAIEGDFSALLKDMRPSASLFVIVKAMIVDAWNQRSEQTGDLRKALRREILKLEKQIDGLLNRLVEATSATTIKAYERKIDQLEQDKLLASERLQSCIKPRGSAGQVLELAMRFLANPCKLWESGDLMLQKMVLRMVFAEPLPYCRNEGYRTPKTTLPFKVLEGVQAPNCKMVPRRRLELPRPFGHRYLKPARLPIPPPGRSRARVLGVRPRVVKRKPAIASAARSHAVEPRNNGMSAASPAKLYLRFGFVPRLVRHRLDLVASNVIVHLALIDIQMCRHPDNLVFRQLCAG